jgi:phytoene synthase
MRPHVAAVYAFARVADDMADEGHDTAVVRQRKLRTWQERLHDAARKPPGIGSGNCGSGSRDELILLALSHTIRSLELPLPLFDDLLSAFGQDITTARYDSWDDVLEYCRRSANPIGRLVLRIAGHRDDALDRSSDALCTALQLTNFWQDFGGDFRAGRLYVPRHVSKPFGADERELENGRMTDAWACALETCVRVTDARFAEGRLVCDAVRGRLRLELRLTWLGGRRILERVLKGRHHLLHVRPTIGPSDLPALFWHAARWRASPPAFAHGS